MKFGVVEPYTKGKCSTLQKQNINIMLAYQMILLARSYGASIVYGTWRHIWKHSLFQMGRCSYPPSENYGEPTSHFGKGHPSTSSSVGAKLSSLLLKRPYYYYIIKHRLQEIDSPYSQLIGDRREYNFINLNHVRRPVTWPWHIQAPSSLVYP